MLNDAQVRIDEIAILRETDKSYLVEIEEHRVWIPKSQIAEQEELERLYDGNQNEPWKFCHITLPGWLVKKLGIM